jgi:hypothetical protein
LRDLPFGYNTTSNRLIRPLFFSCIGVGFGDLVERRPDDDSLDTKRVTENDVQALIQQRQALDNSMAK